MSKFGSLDIAGLIATMYGIYQDQRNWNKMSPSKRQELTFEDEIADENADEAFRKQREFQNEFLTPEAQLKSTAAGYDAIGMNRMMMAGGSPGASSASAPQASSGSASGNPSPSGIFSLLLDAMKIKTDKELEQQRIDIQDKQADAVVEYYGSLAKGQDIENQWKPEILSGQVAEVRQEIENLKDQLNNNRVQRSLWRSGIKANDAKAALDRAGAWLTGINSRIASADANTRERFNYLQNQYLYWAVEVEHANSDFSRKLATKQLSLMSHQIANLAEQRFGIQVDYMRGYQDYVRNKPATKYANFSFWNQEITNDLKAAGIVIGATAGLGKLLSPVPTFSPTIQMPSAGASFPRVPTDISGRPLWNGE